MAGTAGASPSASPPECFFTPRVQGVHGWTWINKQQQQVNQKYREQLERQHHQQHHPPADVEDESGTRTQRETTQPPTAQQAPAMAVGGADSGSSSMLSSPPTRCYFAFRGPVVPRNRVNTNLFPRQWQRRWGAVCIDNRGTHYI